MVAVLALAALVGLTLNRSGPPPSVAAAAEKPPVRMVVPSPEVAVDQRPSSPGETPAATQNTEVTALALPSLGMDVSVAEITPADGVIDPPSVDLAYVIEPYGRPGSDNTTYIAGHSWNAGDAVFNPLLDGAAGTSRLIVGDAIEVTAGDTVFTYEVSGTERYPKGSLAEVDEVWRKVPNRLVLITCFQRNDGAASRDNLVVTADLVATAPVSTARVSTAPAAG